MAFILQCPVLPSNIVFVSSVRNGEQWPVPVQGKAQAQWAREASQCAQYPTTGGAGASWVQALGWVAGGGNIQERQDGECELK